MIAASSAAENSVGAPRVKAQFGLTLVELLVVVLILSILLAVALPLYLGATQESARRTARSNLHMLIHAEQTYRLRANSYTSNMSDLLGNELHVEPKGPGNTVYTLHTRNTGTGAVTLPDGRSVPEGGVAACAKDPTLGPEGDYGCYIPGVDTE
jgi:prepilin-type N-terminal cleavage/methylation domain-containing protein